jgi:hypothetical protein
MQATQGRGTGAFDPAKVLFAGNDEAACAPASMDRHSRRKEEKKLKQIGERFIELSGFKFGNFAAIT